MQQSYNTNPYYFQSNPMYQQPQYNPYQDRLTQLQNQYQQQQNFNQMQQMQMQPVGLNGEIVDGIEVVRAKNVDMSGAVTYYPKADMSEIYTKRLMADGTSQIITYKAVQTGNTANENGNPQTVDINMLNTMFGQLKNDLSVEISGVKELVESFVSAATEPEPQPQQKTQRGGSQK